MSTSISCWQDERTQAVEEVETLKGELAQRQKDFKHTQELQNLTLQEENVSSRLSYERLLAEKKMVDIRLDETEVGRLPRAATQKAGRATVLLYVLVKQSSICIAAAAFQT